MARLLRIGSRPVCSRRIGSSGPHRPAMEIPAGLRMELAARRRDSGLSNRVLCAAVGIRQPVTFYAWEKGISRPTAVAFPCVSQCHRRERGGRVEQGTRLRRAAWNGSGKNNTPVPGRNVVRDYVRLCDLDDEDLEWFASREDLELTPEHYGRHGIPRFVAVNEELMGLLGFYLAEGSCSDRNGIRLSIGKGNQRFAEEMAKKLTSVFGLPAVTYSSPQRCTELKLVNRVAALAWQHVFGFAECRIHDEADSGSGIQCFRGSATRLSARLSAGRRYCLQESNCVQHLVVRHRERHCLLLEFIGRGRVDFRAANLTA